MIFIVGRRCMFPYNDDNVVFIRMVDWKAHLLFFYFSLVKKFLYLVTRHKKGRGLYPCAAGKSWRRFYVSLKAINCPWFIMSNLKCLGLSGSTKINTCSRQKLYVTMAFGESPSFLGFKTIRNIHQWKRICAHSLVTHLLCLKMIRDCYYPTGHVYLCSYNQVRVKFYSQKKFLYPVTRYKKTHVYAHNFSVSFFSSSDIHPKITF